MRYRQTLFWTSDTEKACLADEITKPFVESPACQEESVSVAIEDVKTTRVRGDDDGAIPTRYQGYGVAVDRACSPRLTRTFKVEVLGAHRAS
jgi:hypothetical protein